MQQSPRPISGGHQRQWDGRLRTTTACEPFRRWTPKKEESPMSNIFEELKQALTIEVPVPFVNGISIDLIQVAAFAAIFGGFIVLGGLLRRYLRRLLMKLQVREDRQSRLLGGAYLIAGLIGFIVALNAFGAPRDLMRRLLSYSIPIGQTRLSVTSIAVAVAVVLASNSPGKVFKGRDAR